MNFSERVFARTGVITLFRESDNVAFNMDVTGPFVKVDGKVPLNNPQWLTLAVILCLTAVQNVTLSVPTLGVGPYYVTVPNTCFCTYIDLCYPGRFGTEDWDFVTAGVQVPDITVFPADNSYNVSYGTLARFNFSENVEKGTGFVTITNETDGTVIQLPVSSPLVDHTDDSVVLRVPLLPLASYSITIDSTAFHSFAGLDIAGIASDQDWNFHISDALFLSISADNIIKQTTVDGVFVDVSGLAGYDDPAVVDRLEFPVVPGKSLLAVHAGKFPSGNGAYVVPRTASIELSVVWQ